MIFTPTPTDTQEEPASYAYSYPHKSSYRRLSPPLSLAEVWQDEDVRNLALYVHIPFCEMRCGFCNLFTESQPADGAVDAYLATLDRQMRVVAAQVPDARFAQFAVGGGTPTILSPTQLEFLFTRVERLAQRPLRQLSTSVETSPATATADRLRILADVGVRRISLGVQSFSPDEARRIGRPQQPADVFRALDQIRALPFPVLNIDLIYGEAEQTCDSWIASLEAALGYKLEELYLYPLYVRPQTGLSNVGRRQAEHRTDLYAAARDLLAARGYRQASLRCFRCDDPSDSQGEGNSATYACQRDGMIGLGCGARSYTRTLHYGTRFAVTQAGVRAILRDWIAQSDDVLGRATHGIRLTEDERLRRFVILSLLQSSGLDLVECRCRFPGIEIEALDGIRDLFERGWVARTGDKITLTAAGLEHSDLAGPLLYSAAVRDRLREFVTFAPPEQVRRSR
jgi:oxygen-independent coproporphyrinogen-3 oxidase